MGEFEHVVLISLDTLRSDGIAAHPAKLWPRDHQVDFIPRTPLLDELAASGTWFTHCTTAAPYTSASHASVLTGRWPVNHGLYELFNRKLRGATLFDVARRHGMRTVMKVDFPLMIGPQLGFTRGVDHYLVEDDDAALELIGGAVPSFSLVHFGGIHTPYGFHNLRFGGDALVRKVAELDARVGAAGPPADPRSEADLLRRYRRAVSRLYDEHAYDELFTLYLQGIEHFLQHRFGPFLERLRDRLAGRRHLLVIFGDHGEEYGPGAFGHQDSVDEGVLRVPLILSGDGVPGRRVSRRVRTVDIAPTIMQMQGWQGRTAAAMDGTALQAEGPEEPAYAQSYIADSAPLTAHMVRALRRGRKTGSLPHHLYKEAIHSAEHKLSLRHCRYERLPDGWRLEPIDAVESLERRDPVTGALAPADDPGVAATLRRALSTYNDARRPGTPSAPDEAMRQRMRALGYDL